MDDQSQSLLEQAAEQFGIDVKLLKPLAGGHYAQVYEWTQADGHARVLKLSPPDDSSDPQAQLAMLAWVDYLGTHGAPVARPIPSRRLKLIEIAECGDQRFQVSAAEKVAGVRAELLLLQQWDDTLVRRLGRVIGRCHALAQDYTPPTPTLRRADWDQADNCFNPLSDLADAESFVLERRSEVLQTLAALPKDREGYGLAHLDLHFANFIVDPARGDVTLIDFDDCGYGWYAMDVAMLLFDVLVVYGEQESCAHDRSAFARHFLAALLSGYREAKPFPPFWIAQLPPLLKLLEIGVYAMLARDYDPLNCDDEWVAKFMPDRARRIREGVPYVDLLGEM